MSDLTFAFLEDTNQYIMNYTFAGRLVQPEPQAPVKLGSFLFITGEVVVDPVIPAPPTPGELRWGKNQGCRFVCRRVLILPSCVPRRQHACIDLAPICLLFVHVC
jgi:hypothetical protein